MELNIVDKDGKVLGTLSLPEGTELGNITLENEGTEEAYFEIEVNPVKKLTIEILEERLKNVEEILCQMKDTEFVTEIGWANKIQDALDGK